jgi:type II secretory pathway pseudopilin PulG
VTWILIVSVVVNVVLLILLFMSARRRSWREKHSETLYRRALIMYINLSNDYINLLSCIGTGFIPKRLLNRRPSVKEIFHN